jgi:hypothetical protein
MSQLPKPKLSYKHEVLQGKHRMIIYNSDGDFIFHAMCKTFEEAHAEVGLILSDVIRQKMMEVPSRSLRSIFKPSNKKMDGLYTIDPKEWKHITEYDFVNGLIGVITQAELARIRGVSRQAIHQSVARGDIEIFMWRDEKYIPFDTIAVSPMFYEQLGSPMVIYYAENGKKKKPRRRFKKETA